MCDVTDVEIPVSNVSYSQLNYASRLPRNIPHIKQGMWCLRKREIAVWSSMPVGAAGKAHADTAAQRASWVRGLTDAQNTKICCGLFRTALFSSDRSQYYEKCGRNNYPTH